MNELENKFIIMARIAVALSRKGIFANVGMHEDGFAVLNAALTSYKVGSEEYTVETVFSNSVTESELLEWWSAIEGEAA